MKDPINIAIAGATGYIGLELIKILSKHPKVRILYLCANKSVGKKIFTLGCFDRILINSSPTYPVAPAIAMFNESLIFMIISVIIFERYRNKNLSFRKLKASSCFSMTVLFAFNGSGISRG